MENSENSFPKNELRELEQYFFTENVLHQLVETFQYFNNILCLCTPAVADAFYRMKKKAVLCIDIDDRFSYLPNFIHGDVTKLDEIALPDGYKPDVIIVDPPFFKMQLVDLYNFIEKITDKDKSTKIIFAFVIREDKKLLRVFKEYNLQLTKFKLEYQNVDPTKWENYGIYSNFEQGKIKFIKKNKK